MMAWQTKTASAFRIKTLIAPKLSLSGVDWWTEWSKTLTLLSSLERFRDMDYLIPTLSQDFQWVIPRPSTSVRDTARSGSGHPRTVPTNLVYPQASKAILGKLADGVHGGHLHQGETECGWWTSGVRRGAKFGQRPTDLSIQSCKVSSEVLRLAKTTFPGDLCWRGSTLSGPFVVVHFDYARQLSWISHCERIWIGVAANPPLVASLRKTGNPPRPWEQWDVDGPLTWPPQNVDSDSSVSLGSLTDSSVDTGSESEKVLLPGFPEAPICLI